MEEKLERHELLALGALNRDINNLIQVNEIRKYEDEKWDGDRHVGEIIDRIYASEVKRHCDLIMESINNIHKLNNLYNKYISEDKFEPVDVREIGIMYNEFKNVSLFASRIKDFYKYVWDLSF